ncbi:uncharacterized protein LOC144112433 [Amblyomma americanum]
MSSDQCKVYICFTKVNPLLRLLSLSESCGCEMWWSKHWALAFRYKEHIIVYDATNINGQLQGSKKWITEKVFEKAYSEKECIADPTLPKQRPLARGDRADRAAEEDCIALDSWTGHSRPVLLVAKLLRVTTIPERLLDETLKSMNCLEDSTYRLNKNNCQTWVKLFLRKLRDCLPRSLFDDINLFFFYQSPILVFLSRCWTLPRRRFSRDEI